MSTNIHTAPYHAASKIYGADTNGRNHLPCLAFQSSINARPSADCQMLQSFSVQNRVNVNSEESFIASIAPLL